MQRVPIDLHFFIPARQASFLQVVGITMSIIRKNPMKAIPVLQKRLSRTRSIFQERGRDESFDEKLEKLSKELENMSELFLKVKRNEDELLDTLTEVYGHLGRLDKKRLDEEMDDICNKIRHSAQILLPMEEHQIQQSSHSSSTHYNVPQFSAQILLPMEEHQIQQSSHSSSTHYNVPRFSLPPLSVNQVRERQKLFKLLIYLLIYPENAIIKRRHLIYLWAAGSPGRELEEDEKLFDELLKFNAIVPCGNGKCPIVNKFKIHPQFHRYFIISVEPGGSYTHLFFGDKVYLLTKKKVVLRDQPFPTGERIIINIATNYLNIQPQWLNKRKYLEILQLGRWQDLPSHHIEVDNEKFLEELGNQKELKYLSLRGISRIFELPSFALIESLRILDLKACHNLETLPNNISSMKRLKCLILSHCYLLDAMPKGIEKLAELEVLKGFVISNSRKTPCKISDLSNLKRLRRLSIHIKGDVVIKDMEFESLGRFPKLEHLKISWGVFDKRQSDIPITTLPLRLRKLHLECFFGQKIPEWLKPSMLPSEFKELKITGGKLQSMNLNGDMHKWAIEILHLKYLQDLEINKQILHELFPLLRYVEMKKVSKHPDYEWSSVEKKGKSKSVS
ncbi:hypothetical protein Fmac_017929 [Flemingia macrophylla]|uniref:Disease resistance R13L4/SHOC-2-like LRR domain-containing protein n=1 Tax=Flemingia macrophylla TaxID=520843 RepID=A0ABD1M477_9FABA